jgi:hypothetical protein
VKAKKLKLSRADPAQTHRRSRMTVLAENNETSVEFSGSAQEFGGACILSRFLKNDKFCFCDRHALRLEQ